MPLTINLYYYIDPFEATAQMKKNPLLSIVIANYNNGKLLPAALESILCQDCNDYEVIVVDGGSTDNSVDIIRHYEAHLSWWVSEPDHGQSNAFNKGYAHANGRFLTWLNADDLLLPGTVSALKRTVEKHPEAEWITGNFVRFLHSDGTIIEAPWGPHYLPGWLQGDRRIVVSFGPTTFWSRHIYDTIGPLDEELHYVMDIDYWQRINNQGFRQIRLNHACWGFRMHEDSKTAEYGEHKIDDKATAALQNEKRHINLKNHYSPTTFWRQMGLLCRCIDGSVLTAIYRKCFVKGKKLTEYYHFSFDTLLNK